MICPICHAHNQNLKPAKHLNRFYQCQTCTGYFSTKKEEAVYEESYFDQEEISDFKGAFSPLLNFFLWLREKRISKYIIKNQSYILDYGCGDGRLVAYLTKKGFQIDGYDPSSGAVTLAQKRGLPVFGTVPSKKYDFIMFWHSLEHTDTPFDDVTNLRENITPLGKVLVAVPNGDSLEAMFGNEFWFCYDWPFHRIHFNFKSIKTLFEKAGFRIIDVDFFNPEYTFSSLVQTFLNLFLPKNALYSMVSSRRGNLSKTKLLGLVLVSLILLVVFSPFLLAFFLIALLFRKTAAFIVVAERM